MNNLRFLNIQIQIRKRFRRIQVSVFLLNIIFKFGGNIQIGNLTIEIGDCFIDPISCLFRLLNRLSIILEEEEFIFLC